MNQRTRTLKAIAAIRKELYGAGPMPPLRQVVKDKYYHLGDCSYIRCQKCHGRLKATERNNYHGICDACMAKREYEPWVPPKGEPSVCYPESWRHCDGSYG